MSKTMLASFKKLSKRLRDSYNPNCILEIGSNDGSLIKNFSKKKVICVEPCKNFMQKLHKNLVTKLTPIFGILNLLERLKQNKKEIDLI